MPGLRLQEPDRRAFVCMRCVEGHMAGLSKTLEKIGAGNQPGKRLSSWLTGVRIFASGLCSSTMRTFLRMLSSV